MFRCLRKLHFLRETKPFCKVKRVWTSGLKTGCQVQPKGVAGSAQHPRISQHLASMKALSFLSQFAPVSGEHGNLEVLLTNLFKALRSLASSYVSPSFDVLGLKYFNVGYPCTPYLLHKSLAPSVVQSTSTISALESGLFHLDANLSLESESHVWHVWNAFKRGMGSNHRITVLTIFHVFFRLAKHNRQRAGLGVLKPFCGVLFHPSPVDSSSWPQPLGATGDKGPNQVSTSCNVLTKVP